MTVAITLAMTVAMTLAITVAMTVAIMVALGQGCSAVKGAPRRELAATTGVGNTLYHV